MKETESSISPDLTDLERCLRAGMGRYALAERFKVTTAKARSWLEAYRREVQPLPSRHINTVHRKRTEALVQATAESLSGVPVAHREAIICPASPDRMCGIAFMSDVHWGSPEGFAAEQFENDVQTILDTPDLYVVLGGDIIDNHIKHLAAILASGTKPAAQWDFLADTLDRLSPKILAVVSGNHEAWTVALSGHDALGSICRDMEIVYDPAEVVLYLRMEQTEYTIGVRHKYRFNSTMNPTNSVKQYWHYGPTNWDVGCVGDKHVATVEPFDRHGVTRWAVRPGSYQVFSQFSKAGGWPAARPVTPVVLFHPFERKMHAFADLFWGSNVLKGMNDAWQTTKANTVVGGVEKARRTKASTGRRGKTSRRKRGVSRSAARRVRSVRTGRRAGSSRRRGTTRG